MTSDAIAALAQAGFTINVGFLIVVAAIWWWLGQSYEDWIEPWCRDDYKEP